MTKKKSNSGKATQPSAAQLQAHTLNRLKTTCDQLVGPGYFEKFSPFCKSKLLSSRFPPLKMKITPGPGMSLESAQLMSEIFSEHLNKLKEKTATETQMPLSQYMREGLTLIFYVQLMDEQMRNAPILKTAFQAYAFDGELMNNVVSLTVGLLHRISMICSDWSTSLFSYDINSTAAYNRRSFGNYVSVNMHKPETASTTIDGHKRTLLRIGWTNCDGEIQYLSIPPAKLGIQTHQQEEPRPVYIQRHALDRLDERLSILPGFMHYHLYEQFKTGKLTYRLQGATSLVEFSLFERKLGYLVCILHEEKIIIRTFLFLTNDGTPEGKKLAELTQLQLLDKQYLCIDTLEGFLKFGIAEDPQLTQLFTQAGCADLLDLSELKTFYHSEVQTKDPAILLQYLMGRQQVESLQTPESEE